MYSNVNYTFRLSFIKGNLFKTSFHILITTEDYILKLIFIFFKEIPFLCLYCYADDIFQRKFNLYTVQSIFFIIFQETLYISQHKIAYR